MALSLALKTEAGRSLSSRPGLQRVQSRDYTEKPYLEKKKKEKKRKRNPAKDPPLLYSSQRKFKSPEVLLPVCPVTKLSSAPKHFKTPLLQGSLSQPQLSGPCSSTRLLSASKLVKLRSRHCSSSDPVFRLPTVPVPKCAESSNLCG